MTERETEREEGIFQSYLALGGTLGKSERNEKGDGSDAECDEQTVHTNLEEET